MATSTHKPVLLDFFDTLTGKGRVEEEKHRLEAFLNAFPGAYCGFSEDQSIIYNKEFLSLLSLPSIKSLHDIQEALVTSDAAILEGMYYRLKEEHKNFSVEVSAQANHDQKLRLTGTQGQSESKHEQYIILWLEDVTHQSKTITSLEQRNDDLEKEIVRFKNSLNSIPWAAWLRNAQQDLIWCNQAYSDIVGIENKKVILEQKEFSVSPKDKTILSSPRDLAKKALNEGIAQNIQCHITTGGNRYFIELNELPVLGTDMTLGILKDLTDQQEETGKYERDLSANKNLLENLRSGISIFNSDKKLEFFNPAYAQMWGMEEQWLNQGPRLNDVLDKLREMRRLPEQADYRKYKENWLSLFTDLIDPFEEILYLPDDTILRRTVIPHPMGGLMITFEDVTSNIQLESSYNTLIAVQKETLDNLAEGVAVYGEDGRLKLFNPSFMKLWDFNPEDVDGSPHTRELVKKMKKFFDDGQWNITENLLLSQSLERDAMDGRIERKDGKLIEYVTVPLPDGGMMVSYFDVTDAAQVEKALREKNTALEVAEKIKTDFLANVSYQLRTPLSSIMGFSEILDNEFFGKLNDKQKEYTIGIQEAGQKLVRLIDDILDLSSIEAGYLDLAMKESDAFETLKNIHELTKEWGRQQEITVNLTCDKDIGIVIADETRLKQVIINLVHNAISFTPAKGKIILSAYRHEEYIEFSVSDTGAGISEKDQTKIFEPFEKLGSERRTDMSNKSLSRGAGLGLSLVKNIVELHGGYVEIDSKEGNGTTVSIFIPIEPVLEPLF